MIHITYQKSIVLPKMISTIVFYVSDSNTGSTYLYGVAKDKINYLLHHINDHLYQLTVQFAIMIELRERKWIAFRMANVLFPNNPTSFLIVSDDIHFESNQT